LVWFKFIMFFGCIAAALLAGWSIEVARMFARRVAKERQRVAGGAAMPERGADITSAEAWPAAAVILPIKGVDAETAANLEALLAQDYPKFRLLFAVESAEDPVVGLLAHLAEDAGVGRAGKRIEIRTVIAGLASTRGQKIHNQLAAVGQTTAADEVLVFMDADARPAAQWLRELIKPLVENGTSGDVGATTGFRFYVPSHARKSVADAMVSVINAGVAALLGPGWRNMAWGGSMALRRADFFAFGIDEAWQHALSDDYVLSYCVKTKAKRRIQFVQGCLVESAADFTWGAFWEFAARQYRITRICAPLVWLTAVGAALLYLGTMIYALTFWIVSVIPQKGVPYRPDHPLLMLFAAIYLANVIRGYFLWQGGMAAFPAGGERLRAIVFWYTWGYPVTLAVNLVALFKAALGRTVEWRGVRYHMASLLETGVERGSAAAGPGAGVGGSAVGAKAGPSARGRPTPGGAGG